MIRCATTIAAVLVTLPAWAGDFVGPAAFKDADSPWMDGRELRIANGLDAIELTQVCTKDGAPWFAGQDAAAAVRAMFAGKTMICADTGDRSYGRPLVTCTVDGQDVAAAIIRAGWGMDWEKYSAGSLREAQAEAKAAGRGIWAGECLEPWVWRKAAWGK
ncbi:MAG: thermonuclease family protein [Alphaproteobacteria bacterium]|nr:thermonuclease family protein [Alphaproteobacteria bacterium]